MSPGAITLRPVETERDLEAWVRVKNAVVPNEPITAAQVRASDEEGRLLLLAELDGEPDAGPQPQPRLRGPIEGADVRGTAALRAKDAVASRA